MNAWWVSSVALVASLALPLAAVGRGSSAQRFVALQLISSLTMLVLIALSFALGQSSFIELPLALALLSLPGTLLMALFLERWL
jgi:multisubunit Na+/H+ antiporter MnhF subunit